MSDTEEPCGNRVGGRTRPCIKRRGHWGPHQNVYEATWGYGRMSEPLDDRLLITPIQRQSAIQAGFPVEWLDAHTKTEVSEVSKDSEERS